MRKFRDPDGRRARPRGARRFLDVAQRLPDAGAAELAGLTIVAVPASAHGSGRPTRTGLTASSLTRSQNARRLKPTTPHRARHKPKKSVALSGVTAGNTALCTVGRTGNDLHYRGYDILDVADACEFEEIAHLLVHGTLPTQAELAAYKAKLRACAASRPR